MQKGKCKVRKRKRIFFTAFFISVLILSLAVKYIASQQKKIIDVPYISQQGSFVTGCELVSATMVLKYYGYDISVDQVVDKTPKSDLSQSENGIVGESPDKSFIGNPQSSGGFGCYAPVVTSVMNSFFEKTGTKTAVDITGVEIESLTNDYIKQDTPVIMWATMNMKEPRSGKTWTIKGTGETFQWIAGEHCLVLVGYDSNNYYFDDPYQSNGLIAFEKSLVKKRFNALGRQAVVVKDANAA